MLFRRSLILFSSQEERERRSKMFFEDMPGAPVGGDAPAGDQQTPAAAPAPEAPAEGGDQSAAQ